MTTTIRGFLFLALLAAFAGCRQEVSSINWESDGKVSADVITAACGMWAAIGVACAPASPGAADVTITGFDADNSDDGQTDPWHGMPIRVSMNLHWLSAATVAHEFGHCLGLGHLDSGPAIMNTVQSYSGDMLTPVDIAGYRSLYPPNDAH